MPNLSQIYSLKQHFYQLNERDERIKDYLEKSEAKDVLQKAFNAGRLNENADERRLFSFLRENLSPAKPDLIRYFEEGREENIALLFIDISSFSKTITGWPNAEIKAYLDRYYRDIIPIIYRHGGEIEKLMGDGIIAVFGMPFLNLRSPEYVYKAEQCAEEAIKLFHNTNMNVKVAIHKGVITYYKVPGEHYGEYTIIGQPITDLYRLESISKANAINFYADSEYDRLGWHQSVFDLHYVRYLSFEFPKLQGVDFRKAGYIIFPGYN